MKLNFPTQFTRARGLKAFGVRPAAQFEPGLIWYYLAEVIKSVLG